MLAPWSMEHGAWCMVHGAWCMVHGAWCMMRGAWCLEHGSLLLETAQHWAAASALVRLVQIVDSALKSMQQCS